METNFRPATRADITFIAQNMRDADIAELKAAHGEGISIDTALYMSFIRSEECSVWLTPEGEPMAVFGFTKLHHRPGVLVPWLLGTNKLKMHAKAYVAEAKRVIDAKLELAPYLFNFVHASNKASVRFLKLIGFTIHEAEPFGKKGEMFHMFDKGDLSAYVNTPAYDTLLTSTKEETRHVH